MKYEIIRTNNYLLVVDGSEVTPLNWCLDTTTNLVFQYYTKREVKTTDKKIIAHLPLNGSSILEGVDLLPPLEDEVEKSAHIRVIGSEDDVIGSEDDVIDCDDEVVIQTGLVSTMGGYLHEKEAEDE